MSHLRKFFGIIIVCSVLFLPGIVGAAGELDTDGPPGTNSSVPDGTGFAKLDNPLQNVNSLQGFVEAILNNIVLPIGSIVVVFFIIYSGFLFVTARGNEDQLEKAKHSLLYVVIGATILLGSLAISLAIKGTVCEIAPRLPYCRTR